MGNTRTLRYLSREVNSGSGSSPREREMNTAGRNPGRAGPSKPFDSRHGATGFDVCPVCPCLDVFPHYAPIPSLRNSVVNSVHYML